MGKLRDIEVAPTKSLKLWLILGWMFIALIVCLSLTPSPPDVALTRSGFFLHLSGYTLLMGWFSALYRPHFHLQLGMRFVAMGVALEILQGLTSYRLFEYIDMIANGVGVLLGWCLVRMCTEISKAENHHETNQRRE